MGHFYLVSDEGGRLALPDDSGGSFDAAGDFEELLFESTSELQLLGRIDPYADSEFESDEAQPLLAEIDLLLARADLRTPSGSQGRPGIMERGLRRLRSMVVYCAENPGSRIAWSSD